MTRQGSRRREAARLRRLVRRGSRRTGAGRRRRRGRQGRGTGRVVTTLSASRRVQPCRNERDQRATGFIPVAFLYRQRSDPDARSVRVQQRGRGEKVAEGRMRGANRDLFVDPSPRPSPRNHAVLEDDASRRGEGDHATSTTPNQRLHPSIPRVGSSTPAIPPRTILPSSLAPGHSSEPTLNRTDIAAISARSRTAHSSRSRPSTPRRSRCGRPPDRLFPTCDDWDFAWTACEFAQTGRMQLGDWPAMTLVSHAAWGGVYWTLWRIVDVARPCP